MSLTTESRLDLMQRYAMYGYALDTFDVEALVALFAPDGVLAISGYEPWNTTRAGRDQVRSWAQEIADSAEQSPLQRSQHRMSNIILTGAGVAARGACYVDWIGEDKGSGDLRFGITGVYVDEWTLIAGEWLLARRELIVDQVPNLHSILTP